MVTHGVFTLWKFTKLYTCDLCTFLYVCSISEILTEKCYVYNLNWVLNEQYNSIYAVNGKKIEMVDKLMKSSTSLFLENAN